jgi:hypothetical protein
MIPDCYENVGQGRGGEYALKQTGYGGRDGVIVSRMVECAGKGDMNLS